jgi:hypothetical protein
MNNSLKYVNIEEEVRDKRKIELQVQRNFLNRHSLFIFVLFSIVKGGTVSKELTWIALSTICAKEESNTTSETGYSSMDSLARFCILYQGR